MKFKEEGPLANVDAAVKKLLEIANGLEADHAGRLHVGAINRQFLDAGGSVAEYTAAVQAAVDRGYIAMHPSGAYVTFTQAGAELSATGWKRPFDDPIPLPRGRQLVTLEDAAGYIQELPKAEQDFAEWQAAVEAMLLVVEHNGPTMMTRIGVMRALNRHVVREFDPSRKDTHWGRRKLKRDQ
jgi:hypothetical protein